MPMSTGFMVIVDISGYTSFIKAHSNSKKSNFIKKLLIKLMMAMVNIL